MPLRRVPGFYLLSSSSLLLLLLLPRPRLRLLRLQKSCSSAKDTSSRRKLPLFGSFLRQKNNQIVVAKGITLTQTFCKQLIKLVVLDIIRRRMSGEFSSWAIGLPL